RYGAVVAGGREVVANYQLVGGQAEVARVLADEAAREDRRRQGLVIVALDGVEKALADLRGVGDFLQRDAADFTLPAKLFTERCELRRLWLGFLVRHRRPGILVNSFRRAREKGRLIALDAAPEVGGGGRIVVNDAQIATRQKAQLRRGDGTGRRRIHRQRAADGVARRPLLIGGQEPEFFGRGGIGSGEEEQVVFANELIRQRRREDVRIGIEEQHLDQRVAAAFRGGDFFAEGELRQVREELRIDGTAHLRRYRYVDRQPQQIGPVEVVHQLDRMRQRRGAVLHQTQTDGVEGGQPLASRERLADCGGAVRVVEHRQRFVLEHRGDVVAHECGQIRRRVPPNSLDGRGRKHSRTCARLMLLCAACANDGPRRARKPIADGIG